MRRIGENVRCRASVVLTAALFTAGVVGCGSQDPSAAPPPTQTQTHNTDARQLQQAHDALARWDAAVTASGGLPAFVPVGDQTGQIGTWEPDASDDKSALGAGKIVATVAMPNAPTATAQVRWQDGVTRSVPTISAAQALANLVADAAGGSCGACLPLQVTGAQLTTADAQTNRGFATVPIWEYTLRGTAVRVTRIAVAASATVTVTPPPWASNDPPSGLSIDSASTKVGTRQLTVTFIGAPDPANKPCGADYTATAVESANAVVVILTEHPHSSGEICAAVGARRTTIAELASPLGSRAVLEVRQGLPVPVTDM